MALAFIISILLVLAFIIGVLVALAFIIALIWAPREDSVPVEGAHTRSGRRARIALAAVIAAVGAASIGYRLLVWHNLGQTSALFIGIPMLLALVVVLFARPRSSTGLIVKAVSRYLSPAHSWVKASSASSWPRRCSTQLPSSSAPQLIRRARAGAGRSPPSWG